MEFDFEDFLRGARERQELLDRIGEIHPLARVLQEELLVAEESAKKAHAELLSTTDPSLLGRKIANLLVALANVNLLRQDQQFLALVDQQAHLARSLSDLAFRESFPNPGVSSPRRRASKKKPSPGDK